MLIEYRKQIDKKLNTLSTHLENIKNEEANLIGLQNEKEEYVLALDIVQKVGENLQEQAHKKIATIVSKCLQTVFEKEYIFKIVFEKKRNKTEARLIFEKDDMEVDPLTASGGGIVDVAAFGLRIACILMSKPKLRKVIILDEPFKFVSESYRENVKQLLENLSKEMETQIIMVTHIPEIVSGNVISL